MNKTFFVLVESTDGSMSGRLSRQGILRWCGYETTRSVVVIRKNDRRVDLPLDKIPREIIVEDEATTRRLQQQYPPPAHKIFRADPGIDRPFNPENTGF